MRLGRIVAAVALILALLPVPAGAQAGRTPFDRLGLATPEATVARFVAAWRGRDYVTVFWILAPATQTAVMQDIYNLSTDRVLGPMAVEKSLSIIGQAIPSQPQWDQTDQSWMFDRLMLVGMAAGASPLTLPDQGTPGPAQTGPGGQATVLFGTGAGTVTFRLVLSPAGQWRLVSAMGADGDPDLPPWGLGKRK